jgi:hypothetical protein
MKCAFCGKVDHKYYSHSAVYLRATGQARLWGFVNNDRLACPDCLEKERRKKEENPLKTEAHDEEGN